MSLKVTEKLKEESTATNIAMCQPFIYATEIINR
jgi:hypothetical protein